MYRTFRPWTFGTRTFRVGLFSMEDGLAMTTNYLKYFCGKLFIYWHAIYTVIKQGIYLFINMIYIRICTILKKIVYVYSQFKQYVYSLILRHKPNPFPHTNNNTLLAEMPPLIKGQTETF